jgi:oligoribonuclease NrnB/cAMP/cGMP phosphodiesterase (DHH superfamily)
MPTHVLYHGDCPDGFGAAYAFHKFYSKTYTEPKYVPMKYRDQLPTNIATGDHVYMLDYSIPKAEIEKLRIAGVGVTVIDHHKTAEEDLKDVPGCIFNMDKSGATMAWQYMFGDAPVPALLAYVEDGDLWRFDLPHSRDVRAWIRSFPYEFEAWRGMEVALEQLPYSVFQQGEALRRLEGQQVAQMTAPDRVQMLPIGDIQVPVVNAAVLYSEVGEALNKKYPQYPFSAYWFKRADGKEQWGLRTQKDDVDVSMVARQYGGGGHRKASGFIL